MKGGAGHMPCNSTGGGANMSAGQNGAVVLHGGEDDPELTDSVHDYFLPDSVRSKLPEIENIKSYSQFEEWLSAQGIELDTMIGKLKGEKRDDEIASVRDDMQKLAVAIETYKAIYGENAMSKLKKVVLGDEGLDTQASYFYNTIGENDPDAGTIKIRSIGNSGRVVFHELAHALQDSMAKNGEDAVGFANRMHKKTGAPGLGAYAGASSAVINAEEMADALAFGFALGHKKGLEYISKLKAAITEGGSK